LPNYFQAIEADPKQNGNHSSGTNYYLKDWSKESSLYLVIKDNMINGFDDIDYLQNIKENCWVCRQTSLLKNKQ
jgi:hypothetical protein